MYKPHTVRVPNMNNRFKYWDIYDYRFKELPNNIYTKSANVGGASRALLILIPYLAIISLFEYLWKKLFVKKPNNTIE